MLGDSLTVQLRQFYKYLQIKTWFPSCAALFWGQRLKEAGLKTLMVFNILLFGLCGFSCLFALILAHYHVLVQL